MLDPIGGISISGVEEGIFGMMGGGEERVVLIGREVEVGNE